jgi:hypothetical protein
LPWPPGTASTCSTSTASSGNAHGSTTGTSLDVVAVVTTPRPGGIHLWVPTAAGKGNKQGVRPGIDYRGLGGYVLVPPSLLDHRPDQHPGTYRFLRPPDPARLMELTS